MHFVMKEDGYSTTLEYGELTISSQNDKGFRPYQLLVSSIVGCSGGMLKKILQKMRIPFNTISISTSIKRNPDIANRIEAIHLTYTIVGEEIDASKIEKALVLTRKNCGMIQSVKDSIQITETFEITRNIPPSH